ncbi:hypothetical protein B0J11DRAFT_246439 [Dendryphion nanum]|uniref:DUF1168 domain-containing protein n=1 Tax=Dendryphion nanum TaxID=256645 RepID=A0A9P9IR83_9PLEO|nr:hypothetical protein B0J11DRAFT_246439 [Dendryphion nanum]
MSENIPESVPTSADPRSKRPTKKRALAPRSGHAAQLDALFAKPDREIQIPLNGPQKGVAPPPEIVANVQGSSAGAGSGEFHVYKASRRREYERLRLMDDEVQREADERLLQEKRTEQEKKDREKTEKNRAKREKQKARKVKQKHGQKVNDGEDTPAADGPRKKKLPPKAAGLNARDGGDEEGDVPDGGEVKNTDEIGLVIQDDDD